MSNKKTTPEGLYLKDLRKSSKYKSLDNATASRLFKALSLDERERYTILSRKKNEVIAARNVGTYTTQRDTVGTNLKDVTDQSRKRAKWEEEVVEIIKKISDNNDVIKHEFVAVEVVGTYFSRPNDSQTCYTIGEISFVKFSIKRGIIKSLVLFPDCLKISAGYRESLYEDLEETVGFRPDTFSSNCSLEDCSKRIREFFSGVYDPLYVLSREQLQQVGISLYYFYSEIGQKCPWLHSLLDWGQYCTIYCLDDLVSNILNKKNPVDKPLESISTAYVREHWLHMNQNMAAQCCERHQQYGLPNQCPYDILVKALYSTFVLLHPLYKDEMMDIRKIVSKEFFKNLDFVLNPEKLPSDVTVNRTRKPSNDHWIDYVFEEPAIEDIINGIEAIVLKDNRSRNERQGLSSVVMQPVALGRGRGVSKNTKSCVLPGESGSNRKIKLPKVVC